jgi:two-component sensor histidine kinase
LSIDPSMRTGAPVVEPVNTRTPDLTRRALYQRICQQEILSELGVKALQGASFEELLSETACLVAEGLDAGFSKILEYLPSENQFVVRAGVGWGKGVVGVARLGADLASPAGFALRTGKPVISNHLENEERFRTPEILQKHGVRRAMNVILQGDGRPFGVLEVDSRSGNDFVEYDLAFLQGAANILGMAIERERHQRSLKAALDRHKVLLKEMNHRVKNSLAMAASVLALQANEASNPELTTVLEEASRRILAIAKAHEQLSHSSGIERMDIGTYIKLICADLDASVANCEVLTEAAEGIEIDTGRAIAVAMIVNELIVNAAKYAYEGKPGGKIWVAIARTSQERFEIKVRDEGRGLPPSFNPGEAKGLGMRIVSLLARQLGASMSIRDLAPGSEFSISVPLAHTPG